jgi:hypothetical protein
MAHFERVLGKSYSVRGLSLDDLQGYHCVCWQTSPTYSHER